MLNIVVTYFLRMSFHNLLCVVMQASPYAAMLAAQDVAALCKERGITALHIKMRASGGTK